uniref:Uncharacterized protein n=1 Tax=Meloidogyne javanica TaxID=6303 RepID=A0A915NBD7_MELJA
MGSHLFFNENLDGHQPYFPISQQRLLSSHPSIKNKDQLYNIICNSILPATYSNLEPLRVGSLGDILLTREEYKSEEFDEQDWITLERFLDRSSSTPEINFLSFLVEADQYLPNMLSFLHRCLILMPKTMSDSLPLFDEIFIEFWENAKTKKCIRYTSTFLSILIRQSLDKFSTKINSIVIAELESSQTILVSNLQHIKQFYSLNTHALANLFKNSNCVPPFENFSKNSTSNSTSWFIVEEEVKRRLGCLNNTNEDYANIFYKNNQIQKRLNLKIIHFLQIVIQAVLGQLTSINDYYIKKLIDQIESSNTLLQKLIEIAKEWNECLESLYFFINNTLVDPLDEIVKIVNEYVETSLESTKTDVNIDGEEEEDDDDDVKKYLSLQSRLERVYLFTINVEFEEERTTELQQILFSNDDERTPQIKDCLFLIKMLLAT